MNKSSVLFFSSVMLHQLPRKRFRLGSKRFVDAVEEDMKEVGGCRGGGGFTVATRDNYCVYHFMGYKNIYINSIVLI